ncbi:2-succinyl-6-hydroxy-2,4-cyclohexadiene-1-carboxylate synthase [Peribacillus saganii]|uniref:Putative 2-succinyl-6-hydroxy-2,4-cyclohexadiene-1-carboxylate synthase n=1 Tax=Peribacillus saganii TaxID=2303992 RepID=A0A372LDB3_9BACI|nr:2-succinyl-6-hydroxy-2,4-cyclohexadiene-1-carboxylate synthase [Peribacillus saganii]RFU63646.1 2-succinyl-6-hydroxy-2,4-cyclohexadiene-1-carboxylate synthase [Peribacillus saganii]
MKIISNGVAYAVNVHGEGEPLLMLHGFTGSSSTWDFLIGETSQHFQLILVDSIGHGGTESPEDAERYQIEKSAEDLWNIIEYLGHKSVHLLGYSMGGRLGLTFACIYPEKVKTLILESTSPGLRTAEEREARKLQDSKLAERIKKDGLEAFVDYWENTPLFSSQKILPINKRKSIRSGRLENSVTGLSNSLLGMGTGSQPSWWSQLKELDKPVLLITGEADKKFSDIGYAMKEVLPYCELQIFKGAGHALHVEEPEKFGKIISEFLSKHIRRRKHGN